MNQNLLGGSASDRFVQVNSFIIVPWWLTFHDSQQHMLSRNGHRLGSQACLYASSSVLGFLSHGHKSLDSVEDSDLNSDPISFLYLKSFIVPADINGVFLLKPVLNMA